MIHSVLLLTVLAPAVLAAGPHSGSPTPSRSPSPQPQPQQQPDPRSASPPNPFANAPSQQHIAPAAPLQPHPSAVHGPNPFQADGGHPYAVHGSPSPPKLRNTDQPMGAPSHRAFNPSAVPWHHQEITPLFAREATSHPDTPMSPFEKMRFPGGLAGPHSPFASAGLPSTGVSRYHLPPAQSIDPRLAARHSLFHDLRATGMRDEGQRTKDQARLRKMDSMVGAMGRAGLGDRGRSMARMDSERIGGRGSGSDEEAESRGRARSRSRSPGPREKMGEFRGFPR